MCSGASGRPFCPDAWPTCVPVWFCFASAVHGSQAPEPVSHHTPVRSFVCPSSRYVPRAAAGQHPWAHCADRRRHSGRHLCPRGASLPTGPHRHAPECDTRGLHPLRLRVVTCATSFVRNSFAWNSATSHHARHTLGDISGDASTRLSVSCGALPGPVAGPGARVPRGETRPESVRRAGRGQGAADVRARRGLSKDTAEVTRQKARWLSKERACPGRRVGWRGRGAGVSPSGEGGPVSADQAPRLQWDRKQRRWPVSQGP